jgi:hypothetical protein
LRRLIDAYAYAMDHHAFSASLPLVAQDGTNHLPY